MFLLAGRLAMAGNMIRAQRSLTVSGIRSSRTAPELAVRPLMKELDFSYQPKRIAGRPDFVNRKDRIAVFIDACFWHRCRYHYVEPKRNAEYWRKKIERKVERDRRIDKELRKEG